MKFIKNTETKGIELVVDLNARIEGVVLGDMLEKLHIEKNVVVEADIRSLICFHELIIKEDARLRVFIKTPTGQVTFFPGEHTHMEDDPNGHELLHYFQIATIGLPRLEDELNIRTFQCSGVEYIFGESQFAYRTQGQELSLLEMMNKCVDFYLPSCGVLFLPTYDEIQGCLPPYTLLGDDGALL